MRFNIQGMSCAACSARVEAAVSKLDGVTECSVNLLTNSMTVEGAVSPDTVISAVSAAGYSASLYNNRQKAKTNGGKRGNFRIRLIFSIILLIPLMYLSMGGMLGLYEPDFLTENNLSGIMQMLLSFCVMIINLKFYINGVKGVINLAPNMDTLVSLGSAAAFLYSTVLLFKTDVNSFYFDSAAMILTLISVGKALEERSKGRAADAVNRLLELAPNTANVIRNGEEVTVPIEALSVGDVLVVRPGESFPADAVVLEGESSVDESTLTGESIPVDKKTGDKVTTATINLTGRVLCRAERVGDDTALAGIIKTVTDAAASKAPVQKLADKVSGIFVPIVLVISIITFAVWLLVGAYVGDAAIMAVSVLVISCPCALGLATPVAIMVASGEGAKRGILFKSAKALETAGKTNIIVVDKTGTLTVGKPRVTDIIPADNLSHTEFLRLAASLENGSEHPLARAITDKAKEEKTELMSVQSFKALFGRGVMAEISGDKLIGGSLSFIKEITTLSDETLSLCEELSHDGKTPLLFLKNNSFIGVIAVADTLRDDSKDAVMALKRLGIRAVMLTGDNKITAFAMAKEVGIETVLAGLLPEEKAEQVEKLRNEGRVAFVGDGINDAPALATADNGIAIGAGTDIAIDSADIVLMNSRLSDVVTAIKLSRRTLLIIKENLFWAFIYNLIGIPLAAGAFTPLFGWTLSPMLGAAAMSFSSISVVLNALRLKLYKPEKTAKKEQDDMKKIVKTFTIKVSGMMCEHCAARVKEAILKLEEVDSCEVDLESGEVKIDLWVPMEEVLAAKTIESLGYKVL